MLVYILSIICLLISFFIYPKTDKKLSIITAIVYSIGLLFCYNTVVVCFNNLLHIKGSLVSLSIINFLVTAILVFFIVKKKNIQKYVFNKKEMIVFFCIISIVFLVGYFRFRGFTSISYESGDSGIHYRHALYFSKELSFLNESNSNDLVYGDFREVMPISYVNAGLLINLLSNFKPYKVFIGYDVFCLILSSLMFFITIFNLLEKNKRVYFYSFILTLIYVLAYPLNSFLFGFCYLGLGIMVVNLLYFTILLFKNQIKKDLLFKLMLLFIIVFSVFFSYYFFVPCIYLSLGLYYIYLWKTKKISIKHLLLYGMVTLVIPFLIGFSYYFISLRFVQATELGVKDVLNSWGYGYENIDSIYFFVIMTGVLIFSLINNKKKKEISLLDINLYVLSSYILVFLFLYIFKIVSAYCFYKLFYLYWLFISIWLAKKLIKYQNFVCLSFGIVMLVCGYVYIYPDTTFTSVLTEFDIYHWNARLFVDDKILYTKDEVKLMEKSMKYKDICMENNRFIIVGDTNKNVWYYSVTEMIPTLTPINGDSRNLYSVPNPTLDGWNRLSEYDCVIYFYENEKSDYDEEKYESLYSNNEGVILKKIKK